MNKKNYSQVHLDGVISGSSILNANGDASKINWDASDSWNGFEIRNPKTLYLMDGTKYDADVNSGELIDNTSEYYDSTNKDHVNTAKTKKIILDFSKIMTYLRSADSSYEASSKTTADVTAFKEIFETYFDVKNLVDYLVVSDVVNNWDGFEANWQWFTYDGIKWFVGIYDCDNTMGNWWQLIQFTSEPSTVHQPYHPWPEGGGTKITGYMIDYLIKFYTEELESRYAELRNSGLFTVNHIIGLITDWIARIGNKETFEKEWTKWPDFIKIDSIFRVQKWLETSISNMDTLYNYNN